MHWTDNFLDHGMSMVMRSLDNNGLMVYRSLDDLLYDGFTMDGSDDLFNMVVTLRNWSNNLYPRWGLDNGDRSGGVLILMARNSQLD